ncbi:hypothetical protein DID88_007632 [Monilinia fructigena]|uniref:Uncharacterized protein n=1 Tax=Monilinia fructigena TaxID=38457 RepID=A0A395J817_9HELO|nr:hypothetical protein DID88_007632 [Monilinia fructigena]
MAPLTANDLVKLLTKPPSAGVPYQLSSGTVALYTASDWNSTRTDILLDDYAPNKRHIVPSSQYDQTSYILYNLPVGTVMTVLAAIADDEGKLADLRNCQTTLDLGRRSTIFLSEWAPGKVHSIVRWQLQDTISSVRWRTLVDRQTAALYDSTDGTGGMAYSSIKGWGSTKELASLSDIRLNDCISSFKWERVNPVKEIIEPFAVTTNNSTDGFGLTSVVEGTNDSSLAQPVVVSLKNSTSQAVTISTFDQYVSDITSTLTQSASVGFEGIGEASTEWSVTVNYHYEHTETSETSETTTVELNVKRKLPPTEYTTTAQRWYKDPVTGSKPDPLNNNWYKRVEDVRLSLVGSLACKTTVKMEATPL